ncbi:hypothetical protein AB1Y20_001752 [Prymnesium parvum]|uniref:4-hydroxyphenylpyruvate dioxygenase n=1 Tax=Prymnesium parvum TaxID=97485 RepID=A0AB34KC81_PRYPA
MPPRSAPRKRARLVGCEHFVRHNPRSDRFETLGFHHLELLCGDAKTAAAHFCTALGLRPIALSSMMTGNLTYASHVVASGDVKLAFTAPYGDGAAAAAAHQREGLPHRAFKPEEARAAFAAHGMHVSAVGIHVSDAARAFDAAVEGGAFPLAEPFVDDKTGVCISEVRLYPDGDVRLRFVSGAHLSELPFLPGYRDLRDAEGVAAAGKYGIERVDHVVGNVKDLLSTVDYIVGFTGFHEFAEFTAADVGTVDSGLNSMVLASNNERVLLPINEPTSGGKRKSQILTYLEQHGGPGVQHIALKTNDVFATVAAMRAAHAACGGFELMDRPRESYYDNLVDRIGADALTPSQVAQCRELGILADRDDQGILLQIFTKPVGDRSTLFVEIIQRIGCTHDPATNKEIEQSPGCGGFGKGNFHELFRAIEEYETRAGINKL